MGQILKYGSYGRAVGILQTAENRLGANVLVDDKFGPQTQSALEAIQAKLGLPVTGQFNTDDIPLYEAAIKSGTVVVPPSSNPVTPPPSGQQPDPSAPPASTSPASQLFGVDVSHYDGSIDWATARDQGSVVWAVAKALEGASVDSQFQNNWSNMKNEGIIRSAYCFFHPAQDPIQQADQLLSLASGFTPGLDLPFALDWETTDGTSNSADDAAVSAFLDEVEKNSGTQFSLVYSSVSWSPERGAPSFLLKRTPWIADYSYMPPRIPAPWTNPIQFVQYSGNGNVPGLNSGGQGDVDWFLGSLADLKAFIASTKV